MASALQGSPFYQSCDSSVESDVFTENPYAIKLYEKAGYVKRGYADWRKGRFALMEKKL